MKDAKPLVFVMHQMADEQNSMNETVYYFYLQIVLYFT